MFYCLIKGVISNTINILTNRNSNSNCSNSDTRDNITPVSNSNISHHNSHSNTDINEINIPPINPFDEEDGVIPLSRQSSSESVDDGDEYAMERIASSAEAEYEDAERNVDIAKQDMHCEVVQLAVGNKKSQMQLAMDGDDLLRYSGLATDTPILPPSTDGVGDVYGESDNQNIMNPMVVEQIYASDGENEEYKLGFLLYLCFCFAFCINLYLQFWMEISFYPQTQRTILKYLQE